MLDVACVSRDQEVRTVVETGRNVVSIWVGKVLFWRRELLDSRIGGVETI